MIIMKEHTPRRSITVSITASEVRCVFRGRAFCGPAPLFLRCGHSISPKTFPKKIRETGSTGYVKELERGQYVTYNTDSGLVLGRESNFTKRSQVAP